MGKNIQKSNSPENVNPDATFPEGENPEDISPALDEAGTNINNTVFVFANLPNGQSFRLPGGKTVVVKGTPVTRLTDHNGQYVSGGLYAHTKVNVEDWAEIKRVYGNMAIFKSGLVFEASSLKKGYAMAKERSGLRYGTEPVDPQSPELATEPLTTEK